MRHAVAIEPVIIPQRCDEWIGAIAGIHPEGTIGQQAQRKILRRLLQDTIYQFAIYPDVCLHVVSLKRSDRMA